MLSSIYASKRSNDEGFTLIELLIVVIIIGILAAIALPIFIDQQKVAIDASVQSDVRNTVTNVTNMQAQQETSAFKVAHSGGNTVEVRVENSVVASVKGSSDSAADVDLANPIALGTAYTVDGYNAGGKKYQGPAGTDNQQGFGFDSSTGQFTSVAVSTAGGGGGYGGGGYEEERVTTNTTGFENGNGGNWNYRNFDGLSGITTDQAHSGTSSLMVHFYNTGGGHTSTSYLMSTDRYYTVSGWARTDDVNTATLFYDEPNGESYRENNAAENLPAGQWTYFQFNVSTSDADADHYFRIYAGGETNSLHHLYLDDVTVKGTLKE